MHDRNSEFCRDLDTVLLMEVIRDELWTSNNPYHKTEALPKGNLKGVFFLVCLRVRVCQHAMLDVLGMQ